MQLIPLSFAKELVNSLLEEPELDADQASSAKATKKSVLDSMEVNPIQKESLRQHDKEQETTNQQIGAKVSQDAPVQKATFSEFTQPELSQQEHRNLDMLLDIPLTVTVELGRTKQTIEEILELTSGSVIELDKLAGEPVDVLVNSKLIAKGEVVVIEENFGVRVTDIVSQQDRLMKLN